MCDFFRVLKDNSPTFYAPITLLPPGLLEAMASAYLCLRAIDEIEDHADLDNSTKAKLLRTISLNLQSGVENSKIEDFSAGLESHALVLPEVTYRVGEWAILSNPTIAPRIWDATAAMADRMAYWAEMNWKIENKSDLDHYTFSVAGAVGLLLSDLWAWYDGTQTNRFHALSFARAFQAAHLIDNHKKDLISGMDFYPEGWTDQDMLGYALTNLKMGEAYYHSLPNNSPARNFCQVIVKKIDSIRFNDSILP